MKRPPVFELLVLSCSIFAQAAGGETLIAAGHFKAAQAALEKATLTRIEDQVRNGVSPRAAVRELGVVFTSAADQAYLRSLAGAGPEADRPVKLRALERTKTGYRATAPNGHVAEFATNPKNQRVTVNGHDLPSVSAGAEDYFRALDHELGTARFARLNLRALFGVDPADAFLGAVPIGLIVIAGLLSTAVATAGGIFAIKKINAISVGEYLGRMAKLCERERIESREPFDGSESGKFLKLMAQQNVLDANSGERMTDCTGMVDRLFVKNTDTVKGFHDLTRGEVSHACVNAAAYATCVQSYRKRDATVGVPAPTKPADAGAAGAAQ